MPYFLLNLSLFSVAQFGSRRSLFGETKQGPLCIPIIWYRVEMSEMFECVVVNQLRKSYLLEQ